MSSPAETSGAVSKATAPPPPSIKLTAGRSSTSNGDVNRPRGEYQVSVREDSAAASAVVLDDDAGSIVDHVGSSNMNLSSKRLQIDMQVIREAMDHHVDNLIHVPSELNYADELTKSTTTKEGASMLEKGMSSNILQIAYNS
eukprot:CAMPEP_0179004898 /NCGR_PEP_ID=MMETSP0795-20121207/13583_1 /TAXON_ID=88552 /ORGANISM="Amoebophrya sp., Strain Ameob2" /LENGTH=141 /DNA_ID=CAMNT_0020699257 /DNA_START=242 /DNA_END=668 /DNA_ORIENTATION=+